MKGQRISKQKHFVSVQFTKRVFCTFLLRIPSAKKKHFLLYGLCLPQRREHIFFCKNAKKNQTGKGSVVIRSDFFPFCHNRKEEKGGKCNSPPFPLSETEFVTWTESVPIFVLFFVSRGGEGGVGDLSCNNSSSGYPGVGIMCLLRILFFRPPHDLDTFMAKMYRRKTPYFFALSMLVTDLH